jgi:hypothetical protein
VTHPVAVVDGTFAGTDLHAVYRLQLDEIGSPNIPALAELPHVGPHATGLGKFVANLNMPIELRSYGWQLQHGHRISSADQLRAISHRDSVIQALADVAAGDDVPAVSVRLPGPVEVMTAGWLPSGQRIIRDPAACADIADAWAEAAAALIKRIRSVTGAATTLIVCERGAAQAVNGLIRTASGAGLERSLDIAEVRSYWQTIADQDAVMLFDVLPQLQATAAEICGVTIEWPQGRSHATERGWEIVDGLVRVEAPVGLQLEPHGDPYHDAEQRIQQYLDWGLAPEGLEYVRLLHHLNEATEPQAGTALRWLTQCTQHAGQYAASL